MKSKIILSVLITSFLSIPGVYAAQKSSVHSTHSPKAKCGSCSTEPQEEASPTPVPTPWNWFLNQDDLVQNDSLVERIMSFLTWRFRKDERLFQLGICTGQNLSQNGITIPLNQPLTEEQVQQVQTAKQSCVQQLNPSPTPSPSPSPSPTATPSSPTPTPTVTPAPGYTPVPSPTLAPTPAPGSI